MLIYDYLKVYSRRCKCQKEETYEFITEWFALTTGGIALLQI